MGGAKFSGYLNKGGRGDLKFLGLWGGKESLHFKFFMGGEEFEVHLSKIIIQGLKKVST